MDASSGLLSPAQSPGLMWRVGENQLSTNFFQHSGAVARVRSSDCCYSPGCARRSSRFAALSGTGMPFHSSSGRVMRVVQQSFLPENTILHGRRLPFSTPGCNAHHGVRSPIATIPLGQHIIADRHFKIDRESIIARRCLHNGRTQNTRPSCFASARTVWSDPSPVACGVGENKLQVPYTFRLLPPLVARWLAPAVPPSSPSRPPP